MDSDNSQDEFDFATEKIKKRKTSKEKPKCLACGKHISDRRNLVRHLRKIHCIEPIVRKPQLKCSFDENCSFVCGTSELLRHHLQKVHNFEVVEKVLNFDTKTDFEIWKQEEEEKTNARYVAYTGIKLRRARKYYYLRCHRSGSVRNESNGSQRKRAKPSKGYTQCGATCPSSIRVSEATNGSIEVVYYPVHLGHSLDEESIPYMKLSAKEKEEIVGKIAQGEPVGKIVSEARKTKGTKLSKINLLQRRDVYNLKKNIKYLEKEPDRDGKEIDAWVRNLNMDISQYNPIVFYQPIDEFRDYCLILIHYVQKIMYSLAFDGSIVYVKTKKGKPNVDVNLITVSVICENGDGYPIGFCLTPKTEYLTLHTFFTIIQEHYGTVKPQIFVSDNVSQYYLAWRNVMGECDCKLMCTFDMESYWGQKLTGLKCPVGKQKSAAARLKSILEQPDKDVFEEELSKTLEDWEKDEDMKLFANFFNRFYVKKRFEWATCYRIHSTRKESINRYLEPINEVLESIYEESYTGVSNAVNMLLAFVRDVCLVKLLKWDEQAAAEKLAEIGKSHAESLEITDGVKRGSGSEWVVTDEEFDYVVRKTESECDKKCGIFCEECDMCAHHYNCMCREYVTGFSVCRHLHAVGISLERTQDSKEFVTIALRDSAVSLAKSLTDLLETSTLTVENYKRVLETMTGLREDIENAFTNEF